MLPRHGKIDCRECFQGVSGGFVKPHPDWQMMNDPGAWGGENPEYLVLGFSKGATQAGIYKSGRFEDVAFAGMRPRLTQALQSVGVLSACEAVNEKINDSLSNIAFGSLIRCSVSRKDNKQSSAKGCDVYSCTGPLINKSFVEIPQVIKACANRYLKNLPQSVRVVLVLGNGNQYISQCQELIKEMFPDSYKPINSVACAADGRLWVHLAHPSGLNGHFNSWLNGHGSPGLKCQQAQEAMRMSIDMLGR